MEARSGILSKFCTKYVHAHIRGGVLTIFGIPYQMGTYFCKDHLLRKRCHSKNYECKITGLVFSGEFWYGSILGIF